MANVQQSKQSSEFEEIEEILKADTYDDSFFDTEKKDELARYQPNSNTSLLFTSKKPRAQRSSMSTDLT